MIYLSVSIFIRCLAFFNIDHTKIEEKENEINRGYDTAKYIGYVPIPNEEVSIYATIMSLSITISRIPSDIKVDNVICG